MENLKKSWEKPQLIVLARGTPEENVLVACKAIHAVIGPETSVQDSCAKAGAVNCSNCQSRGGGAS